MAQCGQAMCIETRIDLMMIFFLSRSGIYIVWDGWGGLASACMIVCLICEGVMGVMGVMGVTGTAWWLVTSMRVSGGRVKTSALNSSLLLYNI
jgi:hypothetical protein